MTKTKKPARNAETQLFTIKCSGKKMDENLQLKSRDRPTYQHLQGNEYNGGQPQSAKDDEDQKIERAAPNLMPPFLLFNC